ncbi:MAG: hypothetical protein ACYDD1_15495 [Caulobacteraceae bacterium]
MTDLPRRFCIMAQTSGDLFRRPGCVQPIHYMGPERWIAMQLANPTTPTRG